MLGALCAVNSGRQYVAAGDPSSGQRMSNFNNRRIVVGNCFYSSVNSFLNFFLTPQFFKLFIDLLKFSLDLPEFFFLISCAGRFIVQVAETAT